MTGQVFENYAQASAYKDIYLVEGARTPFADYSSTLRDVNPIDLGICAAKALFEKTGIAASDVGSVVAGNVAQSGFDAYYVPRHIALYAGVPMGVPALLVSRICGTGFEAILQAADQISLGRTHLVLAVGAESMSRNPVASYNQRSGFRMGQVDFRDFLWEATIDPVAKVGMGNTAENLALKYGISREEVDEFAAQSFSRANAAWDGGYFDEEVFAVKNQEFALEGYQSRGLKLADRKEVHARDEHVKPTPLATLQKLKPAFKGVQTGGNSSAIVDGAAAVLVASGEYVRAHGLKPLARIVAGASAGVPPEIMGIGPAPAIRAALHKAGLSLADIGRFEINEAFGAQYLACERELQLDRERVNTRGGAIALGHPLAVSGVRLTHTVARQLHLDAHQFGISSACVGGGQGISILLERAQ